ncbi:MAG: DEAD/DEAH box helicase family protein [Candidatus Gastranaerophilales bacterium]|jgi:type III restriction enzyme|nr:DEAD/DEAH box helicase family protein [Candidatus Gastranaerophilales bacterium]
MLKKYQQNSLEKLTSFLQKCAIGKDVYRAYAECTLENFGRQGVYNDAGFTNIPYVCLRLPTGGGKTFLAAHSVGVACKEYLARDFSLVIWLVPSNQILEQTYDALSDTHHPYRKALNQYFNDSVEILKVDEARSIQKGTLQSNTTIIISTFASWRVDKTEGRKVYEQNGSLSSHFEHLKIEKTANLEKLNGSSIPVHSLANVVYLNNPIFIIDEAHNARTELTFEVIKRLNPACIIEYTATPKTKGNDRSNVLCSVTAAELKAEDMIKMPIELLTTDEWQNAISNAVKQQQSLEEIAKAEETNTGEYIRPIVLFQAQHDSQTESTINVETVKNFLINTMHLPEEQIAVATGTERGIEGKDLSAIDEPIRFIITKQALKEGWDCPFAYVFCSVAKVSSSKDVEQLLGRVLRMPNVKRKEKNELNKAYAFVSSDSFYNTAKNLQDSLISAGFTSAEAADLIEVAQAQFTLGKFFGNIQVEVDNLPDLSGLDTIVKNKIDIDTETKSIVIKENITEDEKEAIKNTLTSESDKEKIEKAYQEIKSFIGKTTSPQKQGKVFSVPQLLIDFDGEFRVFDEEVLLPPDWNLAACDKTLTDEEFPTKVDSGTKGLIDVDSKGNTYTYNASTIQEELSSLIVSSTMDKKGLIQWLVKECRHQSIPYAQIIVFISALVDELIENRSLHIEHLVFMRFKLKDAVKRKILKLYQEAKKKGYEELLFTQPGVVKEEISRFKLGEDFVFPSLYPANTYYNGSFKFSKHFHDNIADMNNEEAECAFNIDANPNVEFWIRNLERQDYYAFWLQTSTDKFYPDFIAKLTDGTIVIIEYKGSDRYNNDDSKEKRQLGDFYAGVSASKCRFIMLNGKDWNALKNKLSIETEAKYN